VKDDGPVAKDEEDEEDDYVPVLKPHSYAVWRVRKGRKQGEGVELTCVWLS
jgi:hypothetical protein